MNTTVPMTSDWGGFSEYSGANTLGYFACMPSRLVPRIFMDHFFTSPMRVYRSGKAILVPYVLRKIEASLVGSSKNGVIVTPPESPQRVVSNEARVSWHAFA